METVGGGGSSSSGAGWELGLQQRLDEYMTHLRRRLGLEGLGLGPFLPEQVAELVRGGMLMPPDQLVLDHNKLESLPPDLLELLAPHLLLLQCSDNRLYSLPKQLASLSALQRLELDRNALTAFPACLGELRQLSYLSVEHNQIGELPASIGDLDKLETLRIANNKLTYLPLEMNRLSRLQHLTIDSNKFAIFPPVIPQITSLRTLSFAFNEGIKEISPIHNLLQLETLTVEEGKKLGIPNELVPSGPSVIHLYLSFLSKFPSINIDLERHWIPDQQASRCAICQANFTTLFRKHHCRMCGRVTCKKCTSKRHAVPANSEGTHRVCDECYALLASQTSSSSSWSSKGNDKKTDQFWGLTEADRQLPEDQQRSRLTEQLTKLDALVASKTGSRIGLEKLVGFYANDPVAQKKAIDEVQQMDDLISSLKTHRDTVTQQLHSLGEGEQAAPITDPAPMEQQDGLKAKVLYTFQAQTEGEITVVAGSIVTLLEEQPNGDWWLIEFKGTSGYVPQTYLSPVF